MKCKVNNELMMYYNTLPYSQLLKQKDNMRTYGFVEIGNKNKFN